MLFTSYLCGKQSGAVEACWAHNPEVRGSKPRSAKDIVVFYSFFSVFFFFLEPSHQPNEARGEGPPQTPEQNGLWQRGFAHLPENKVNI